MNERRGDSFFKGNCFMNGEDGKDCSERKQQDLFQPASVVGRNFFEMKATRNFDELLAWAGAITFLVLLVKVVVMVF